jgi:C4-dicarboxylate-specific signal transduction histidine kinase
MNQEPVNPRSLSREELRFYGTITASVSHEINNVLAMINELSGLLGDNIAAVKSGRPVDAERIEGIAQRIAGQIERGKAIVSALNGFAHTIDNPEASLDLRENLEKITELSQRFARLRRSELVASPSGGSVQMTGCAFELQHLVYRCVEICLGGAGAETPVTIEYEQQGEAVLLQVKSGPSEGEEPLAAKLEALQRLAAEAGGSAEARDQAGQPLAVTLRLPLKMVRTSP